MIIISCKPKCHSISEGNRKYDHFGTTFSDPSYADTFDCLYASGEDKATWLKISLNEKSSLVSTYTYRDLYNILLKAVPGYKYSYDTWRREKMLVILTADCFPSDRPAGVFFPSTLSIEAPFKLSVRHTAFNAVDKIAQPADALSEASLSLFYEDSLSLSSNAAAVQQFMVNESVLSQKPVSSTAPALDGLSL